MATFYLRQLIYVTLFTFVFSVAYFFSPNFAFAALTLEGDNSATSSAGVALPITSLQISGPAASTTPINLVVSNGSLSITNTGGLTFNTGLTGGTINFEGTVENINAALLTLTYTRASIGTDTLEVTLVNEGEVFFPGTGHLYEYIVDAGTWNAAKNKAEALTRYGVSGYLTTIMSQAENDFVAERLQNAGWMGASDSASEGTWRWVTGPENGIHFWSGVANGSTVGGNYANWGSGEPNQSGEEDCGQFLAGGSGKWNDLPCGSTSLPGYVAEFGGVGEEIAVVSKDISLATVSSPTVSAFSPADNASGVIVDGDLVISFSTSMATNTGNIIIYKTADDSVVESISATSSQITITGSTVTISPSVSLDESTAYYIQIDGSLFRNLSTVAYLGITNKTTWNFTTGDFTPPIISDLTSTVGSTSATISWTTNEQASSRVVYGPKTNYGTTTIEANTSPRITSHSVVLSSLLPCTLYYYQVVSRDTSNNSAVQSDLTFTTVGCPSSITPTTATTTNITTASGGSTTLAGGGNTITVEAPSNFTSTSSSVVIQVLALSSPTILANLGVPRTLPETVGSIVFDVKAIVDGDTILDSFDSPVTITYVYRDEDVVGLRESSLWLYHYHDGSWQALDNCTTDTKANTISCTTPSFSIFSLFGAVESNGVATRITGCGDDRALNYNPKAKHDARFCQYTSVASTPVVTGTLFTRDLTIGSVGEDVRNLQKILNELGFTVAENGIGSKGNESNYFGSYTQTALAKLQLAKSISPAVGYFGPVTRAWFVNQASSSTVANIEINSTISIEVDKSNSVQSTQSPSISLFTRDLTGGSTGDDVKALQEFLIAKGYSLPSGATGYFGAETKSALIAFQVDKGITPAQGYFGSITRALFD